jgi:hypothetical protein
MHANHYPRLLAMTALSFIAMYVLMYAMVDEFASVYSNLNQAYMAGLMTAPIVGERRLCRRIGERRFGQRQLPLYRRDVDDRLPA